MGGYRLWALAGSCVLLGTFVPACGDDDDGKQGDTTCPSINGAWKITGHCVASQVGTTVTVHQSGCTVESVDPWTGWAGSVAPDGSLSMSGPGGTSTMTCTGSMSGTTLSISCTPSCDVKLARE